jgi:hypothetical protein
MIDEQIEYRIKKYNEEFTKMKFPLVKREDFTCNTCGAKDNCDWAFDLYNLSGDCLAEK